MFVSDLVPGMKVSIEASNYDAKVNLKTAVAKLTDPADVAKIDAIKRDNKSVRFVVLDAIREKDMLINFNAEGVTNSLVFVQDEKPMIWPSVAVKNLRLPVYGSVHIVVSKREGTSYNRRQHYRIFLGTEGTMKRSELDEAKPVTIKDLSEGGVAFIIRGGEKFQRGDILYLNFTEKSTNTTFNLSVVVIRWEEMPDGRMLYGCRMKNRSELVARLVTQKQQEKAKSAV